MSRKTRNKEITIGDYVRMWRETKGYSLRDLGAMLGHKGTSAKVYMHHIEKGWEKGGKNYRLPLEFLKGFRKLLTKEEAAIFDEIVAESILRLVRGE